MMTQIITTISEKTEFRITGTWKKSIRQKYVWIFLWWDHSFFYSLKCWAIYHQIIGSAPEIVIDEQWISSVIRIALLVVL